MNLRERSVIPKSQSYEEDLSELTQELNEILNSDNFPSLSRNSCPVFTSFSNLMFERETLNPIVFDTKFLEMNSSLSTIEDPAFELEYFLQNP